MPFCLARLSCSNDTEELTGLQILGKVSRIFAKISFIFEKELSYISDVILILDEGELVLVFSESPLGK